MNSNFRKRLVLLPLIALPLTLSQCGKITGMPFPVISSLYPITSLVYGKTTVSISGSGFDATAPLVSVDGTSCPVTSATATNIVCTAPKHSAGTSNWTVIHPDGRTVTANSAFTYIPPASLLGQASPTTAVSGSGATGMKTPYGGIYFDGVHVVVSDTGNNRILIWNSVPTTVNQPADLVLGQEDFSGTSANRGGSPAANTLSIPLGLTVYSGKLIVADRANNRVLIWNTFPTSNGQSADVVIGQPGFTTGGANQGGIGASTIKGCGAVAVDSLGGLYIAEYSNSRVLYYSSIPSTNGASATFVLGQPDYVTSTAVISQSRFAGSNGVAVSKDFLVINNQDSHRVLIFKLPITMNQQEAIHVLGQSNFTSSSSLGCNSVGMASPQKVFLNGNSLYVSDVDNQRILYWSDISTITDGQAADKVFGQPNFTTCTSNSNGISQTSLSSGGIAGYGQGMFADSMGYFWLTDPINNRVTVNLWPQ